MKCLVYVVPGLAEMSSKYHATVFIDIFVRHFRLGKNYSVELKCHINSNSMNFGGAYLLRLTHV